MKRDIDRLVGNLVKTKRNVYFNDKLHLAESIFYVESYQIITSSNYIETYLLLVLLDAEFVSSNVFVNEKFVWDFIEVIE